MTQRHKHADMIIAWANGAKIQFKLAHQTEWLTWEYKTAPTWSDSTEYRIKPKEPIVKDCYVSRWPSSRPRQGVFVYPADKLPPGKFTNVRMSFDPDTGELVDIERIQ